MNFDINYFEIIETDPDMNEGAIWDAKLKRESKNRLKKFFIFFSSCGPNKITLLSSY